MTFFKIFPNCLKRLKNVVWQSADGRVTSTIVAWPFSDFFQNFPKSLETSKKRFLTVGRRSRDLRPLSRDRSATFFEIFPNCLKRLKNDVWQSADGRVTSDHCRVTVQRLFSKFFLIAWNVQKTLFDSRPTVAWPQPLSRDRSATFFKIFPIAWNVQKPFFDSRPTVAWPPTTVAWPFSDFFRNFPKLLKTSKKRCLTVGRRSRDLRPLSRDHSATFFKNFSNCLKRSKNVVWQSADGRVTSTTVAWQFSDFYQNFPKSLETSKKRCLTVGRRSRDSTIVAWPFSDFFRNFPKSLETSKKRCLTVGRRSRDLRPLSRDRSATFFKNFSNCLKRLKNVVWQSAVGRVTSDHSRTASHTASQMYISLLFFFFFFLSAKSLFTYLLLQEWSDPGNFDIISKLGIGRREF